MYTLLRFYCYLAEQEENAQYFLKLLYFKVFNDLTNGFQTKMFHLNIFFIWY